MIRQLGAHSGKQIIFGFDRYILPELDLYLDVLGKLGDVHVAVDHDALHYLSSAEMVCSRIQDRADHVGVLCCGTGMGMSIAANKFRSVYATRCLSVEDALAARRINNSNALCIASKSGFAENAEIITTFMTAAFEGRKLEQLEYITELELESQPAPKTKRNRIPHLLRQSA